MAAVEIAAPPRGRWVMLALVTLVQVSAAVGTQGLGAMTGIVHDEFGLSDLQVGLMVTAAGAVPVAALFVVGDLVDRHGERWVLAAGCLVMTAGLAGAGAAPAYPVVLACLVLAGAGYSTVQPGGSTSISAWFPAGRRGVAMGIRQAGLPVGGAVAAVALPALATALGWRAAFFGAAVVVLAGGVVFAAAYRPAPGRAGGGPGPGRGSEDGSGGLVSRLGETLREPWMRPVLATGVPMVGLQFGLTAYLALFVRSAFHRPLSQGVLLLGLLQVCGVAGRVALAAWSDRSRRPRLVTVRAGMIVTGGSLAVLAVLPAGTPPAVLAGVTAVLGLAGIGWYGPWVAHIADAAPAGGTGRALGAAMAANQVAIVAAPPAVGLLRDLTGSYRPGWLAFAAVTVLAAVSARTRPP
ncbi:MFS transporter [Actinomadura roseirufa]|uniref:MFS transporter n=1 Tax=Actinomadura roseirufa TaxID=2094049 RepID=UPI0010413F3D|nr:MFS transporter [Actinomadura roseirufa]